MPFNWRANIEVPQLLLPEKAEKSGYTDSYCIIAYIVPFHCFAKLPVL